MGDLDNLLDDLSSGKEASSDQYRSALGELGRKSTAKVSGQDSLIAGQYIRKTFTLRPDQIEDIRKLSRKWRVAETDVVRWMVDVALTAAAKGQKPKLKEIGIRLAYDREGPA